jgi:putative PIN family toxin of toxin-antitoxin system
VRIVVDTNVFISGVFFSGPPSQILHAWRDRRIQIALSQGILQEYQRVAENLASKHPGVDLVSILDLLSVEADLFSSPDLPNPVCQDKADDKFLACALAAGARIVVSGDRHLLKVNGYRGIEVIRPQEFVHRHRKGQS